MRTFLAGHPDWTQVSRLVAQIVEEHATGREVGAVVVAVVLIDPASGACTTVARGLRPRRLGIELVRLYEEAGHTMLARADQLRTLV